MILQKLLREECLSNGQIAYNVCCTLWILSYHKFALSHFSDFKLNVIEHVSKILDYFNKEKIVRIITKLFSVSTPDIPDFAVFYRRISKTTRCASSISP